MLGKSLFNKLAIFVLLALFSACTPAQPETPTPLPEPTATRRPTSTPRPTNTPLPTATEIPPDPEGVIALNVNAVQQQSGITVEILRVLVGRKDVIRQNSAQLENDHPLSLSSNIADHQIASAITFRITNDTDKPATFFLEDLFVSTGGQQVQVMDYVYPGFRINYFGEYLYGDAVLPGVTVTGGVWLGLPDDSVSDITTMQLILGSAYSYSQGAGDIPSKTSPFFITIDLSNHIFEAAPLETPAPLQTPSDEDDVFALNVNAVQEYHGVTVEILRVLVGRENIIRQNDPQLANDHVIPFPPNIEANQVVSAITFRITNNTDKTITFFSVRLLASIGDKQVKIQDYMFVGNAPPYYFGGHRYGKDIRPGASVTGGVWFGLPASSVSDVQTMNLSLSSAYSRGPDDVYRAVAGPFFFTIDLSNHVFEPTSSEWIIEEAQAQDLIDQADVFWACQSPFTQAYHCPLNRVNSITFTDYSLFAGRSLIRQRCF